MRFIFIIICFLQLLSFSTFSQNQEKAPGANAPNLPTWTQLMYSENANPEEVQIAYDTYYETHDFVKSGHTQYYKHWLRNLSRDIDGVFSGAKTFNQAKNETGKYLGKYNTLQLLNGPNSSWEGIGPFDFDQDAAERSYASGAAHVYTVEKSASNGNILYAGTATAGLFKSTDNGLNWNLVTRDY
ncbi:MAG: hypothetical protein L3J54_14895, partial [Draconibacterium sp.]|nr:hypothetical protein [Draconibacterium sp.]